MLKANDQKDGKLGIEIAIDLVILDAIEKGCTNPEQLKAYMLTPQFMESVKRYADMISEEFNN